MPDIKEKLVELIDDYTDQVSLEDFHKVEFSEDMADHLIANGVTIQQDQFREVTKMVTNADRLNAMSIEDKAQFLYSIAYARETPWSKPFYEKFCKDCPAPEYTLDDGRKLCLHECEFKDGECPHGTDIVWWLQQPAEEGD